MAGSELVPVKVMGQAVPKTKRRLKLDITIYDVLVRAIGILFARAVPFIGVAPFGLSFMAMERKFSLKSIITLVMVLIGYATLGDLQMAVRYIVPCVIYEIFLFVLEKRQTPTIFMAGIVSGVSLFVMGAGMLYIFGFSVGDSMLLICDVLVMAMGMIVLDKSRELVMGGKLTGRTLAFEEKVSLCIMAAIILLSFKNITLFEGFTLANVMGALMVTVLAAACGVSVATIGGIIIGLLLGIGGDVLISMAVFGACGLCAGALSRWGRPGAAAGLGLCGMALALYLGVTNESVLSYFEIPAAIVLLFLLPNTVLRLTKKVTDFSDSRNESTLKYKEFVQDKLLSASESFRQLAGTFIDISDKQNNVDMSDISLMFDTAADRVCKHCRRAEVCWEKDFNATYKTMFKFLEILERKGHLEVSDIDPYFSEKCVKLRTLTDELNRLYEIYKINQIWKNKLVESRELVGEQFIGVAEIIENIAEEVDSEICFDSVIADEVRDKLEARDIKTRMVEVIRDRLGRYTVNLELKPCEDRRACDGMIKAILRSTLGANMVPRQLECSDKWCHMSFHQVEGYDISVGCAQGKIDKECGDTHVLNYLNNGKYVVTLSDGMGTGHSASRQSGAIVDVLGNFLDAGFDKTVAVKLVNSIMVMKSAQEAFATVDMCVIDLFTGEVEFIKNGAEPSYIKQEGHVEVVRAATLPVGVVSTVEIETFARKLEVGSVIVMVTDGVEMKDGRNGWIKDMIAAAEPDMPPQELADRVAEKSVALKGGEPDDDMTVIVLKVEEKAA